MTSTTSGRAHLIAGGFPPGSSAGHDHDYARLQLLALLAEQEVPASVANDFGDVLKWLPVSRLLITYVAGPYPDAGQCGAIRRWMEDGGRWLALHGTSGGRAERVDGVRQRRTVKLDHHALLGSYFLTHPPICKIRVDVGAGPAALTRGLPSSFVVEDEPYFIELQHPASTKIVLSADYGAEGVSPTIGTLYASDTSLLPDGKTRALAVLTAQRLELLSDVPTMGEAGFGQMQSGTWFGMFAPAGTPREAIDWVNRETKKAFAAETVRQRYLSQGTALPLGSPDEFSSHLAVERQRWGDVIHQAGIRLE